MLRQSFFVTSSVVFAAAALGLATPAGNVRLSEQNIVSPAFQACVATHETEAEWQPTLQPPNASETVVRDEVEAVSSAPPTRSSFMATWEKLNGADGYLLDVSTNDSFTDYVDGYHDLDVGDASGRVVTGLNPGTTYYYRVHPYNATGPGSYSGVKAAATVITTGLTIHATFDSSITNNPNAAAIEAMISRAIAIYEFLLTDPITIEIRFRYAATAPNGTPLPRGVAAQSFLVYYPVPWTTFINALQADAKTADDNTAIASLVNYAYSSNINPSSSDGRAVGLDTPPAMFANGTVGPGGLYDGIVTLNSGVPYQFTRPTNARSVDAQRSTEHEIDEVIGLGSHLNTNSNDLRPQDSL